MNLETATRENLEHIVKEIKDSLKIVNAAIITADDFKLEQYEELLDIYRMIEKKQGRLTMMEIEGVLDELRDLKQNG
ncbi:DUF1128 domain-containing protein [Laceyella sacchari]|uniref:Uncharacterized protein YfkK, UPF0435 family n=2 Tax=Laceyella TaxID=292635 RepID=A0AA45WQ53_9BACL|nr:MULTISPECIES: DUF1128 family protein [Laceyella]AUS09787.1 DUF1128 domain-containing protein [Laceyella sacchari]MRG27576.1 DUF1128 family protein [Laceyella tengchongensis]PRZ14728.1 uncharacterized protein YfkK (UPF0435 family) [Laceyella sediminis]SMP23938.1 Uncharacterized protein YfkK, UPF0435 family [Laceyella tengchongensis]